MNKLQPYTLKHALSTILWEEYSAKEFLPILNLNEHTFRQWGKRGNIELAFPGTGRAVMFNGHEVIYIGALSTLSLLGQPPSTGKTGLKREVAIFTDSFVRGITEYRYCIARTRPLGDCFMEWSLCNTTNPEHHIVDAAGGKKVPGWLVIDLLALSESVVEGLSQALDRR